MIKLGIIGSGFGLYGLLPAFSSIPECQVVALCGKNTERVVATSRAYKVGKLYQDWQVMLQSEQLDALVTAVTPVAQYQILQTAISTQKLHVFAEKPLAVTTVQAEQLLAQAEQQRVIHGIDFIFPEIAAWRKLKKLIDEQELGQITHIVQSWDFASYDFVNNIKSWKTDPQQGGGALAFYFSHCLHYLEYLFGPIAQLKARLLYSDLSLGEGEVGLDLKLEFANGAQGTAHLNSANTNLHEHRLTVTGTTATATLRSQQKVVNGFTLELQKSNNQVEMIKQEDDDATTSEDERSKIVYKLASRFVNACLHNQPMYPNFSHGVRVQQLIEQIRQDAGSLI